jgi:uncharacterized membrane protein YgcG
MPRSDRVRLFAVDVQIQPLSDGFYGPRSSETKTALAKLHARVPLGATNLQAALETALKSFTGDRDRSIIYIGDGMSTAKLIESARLLGLISDLRKGRVPVNIYALGPRIDLQLLGILAEHTGGVLFVDRLIDEAKVSAEQLGRKLAAAACAGVFYPDQINVSLEVDELLPGVVPPIRADRSTILLGKGRIGEALKVSVQEAANVLRWSVQPAATQPGNTFLAALWNQAKQSDGLLVAVAGNELLNVAREEFEDQVQQLLVAGRQALAARDLKQSERLVQAVRQIDPANVEVETILKALQKIKEKVSLVPVALTRSKSSSEPRAAHIDAADEQPATAKTTELLDEHRKLRMLRGEKLTKEVSQTIDIVNKVRSSDPQLALQGLKRTLTTVISSTDVDPDVRETLRAKIQALIDRLMAVISRHDMDRIAALERKSAGAARELAAGHLVQRDEELEQLIDKVSSLMHEGYIGNPDAFERAEEVARAAFELAPYSGVSSAAIFDTEAAGQLDKGERLRYRRYDQFLATLHQLELAHIPFPDEPPIAYPAPEVWKSLTERRQKWASVDLMRWNPTEEKIRRSLDKPTNVEWQDLALEDCITYLHEFHQINILLDRRKLTDEGIALDQPITLRLQGVSLRSVMKLLLEPVQLTYVIENEVMKITTSASAAEKLSNRVYPVGDLVIPIVTPRIGGLGAGIGGCNAAGGIGGGGGGGGIGGGGGAGGGGAGGGFFNVSATPPPVLNVQAPMSRGRSQ